MLGGGWPAPLNDALKRDLNQLDRSEAQKARDRVHFVLFFIKDVANTRIDEHLQALNTWGMRDVDIRITDRVAVSRGLRDRVYLGVNCAITVLFELTVRRPRFVDEASNLSAMGETGW